MKIKHHSLFFFLVFILGWTCAESRAQTLLLRQAGTNLDRVTARIGEEVTIEIVADLQSIEASGISIFMSIPDGPFQVKDNGFPGQVGIQPFLEGPLFSGAGVNANALLLESNPSATHTIFLDVDGFCIQEWIISSGTFRNAFTPAYDSDNDPGAFNVVEQQELLEIFPLEVEVKLLRLLRLD